MYTPVYHCFDTPVYTPVYQNRSQDTDNEILQNITLFSLKEKGTAYNAAQAANLRRHMTIIGVAPLTPIFCACQRAP